MEPSTITFIILAAAVVAMISGKVPLGVTAIGVSLALYLTGVLTLDETTAGFGDPTVLFIAALFVVAEALEITGITAWAGHMLVERGGTRRGPLLVLLCLMTAALTALISVNGTVAAFLPLVVVVASRVGIPASQMLMPLAFSAHAGSLLALTGTPVNIIVSDAAVEAGARPFEFFEFALAGLPLLTGTILLVVFLGTRLFPERPAAQAPADAHRLAALLREEYGIDDERTLMTTARGVTEVLVPPRSPLVGLHVYPGMATPSGSLVVLAARRGDDEITGHDSTLQAGDILLLDGTWDDLVLHTADDREVLVVNAPGRLRRSVPLGAGAKRTMVVLVAMIVLLTTGILPAAVVGLGAACALILLRVVTPPQAYRSVSWTIIVLVAGMIPLATAFTTTGAADLIARHIVSAVGSAGPTLALAAIVLVTLVLGQLISNTATVLILVPVAVATASTMNVSVLPFLMALTVAGAASFLTPVATAANLMVMEPGGYRFVDYIKAGWPFFALFGLVAIFYVPLIWRF
ncbi:SLC13 family permease [Sanguibacter sp. A247]|uniref:SLC13 family permease n=1 Tax=unclassified Sanguibacter TaxID=2645534 RepID=UPI003FD7EDF6